MATVQRGEITLSGETSDTVTLDTPVPVGSSFVLMDLRSSTTTLAGSAVAVRLATEVEGNWTEVSVVRGFSSGTTVIQWSVISGDEFTVQRGQTTIASTDNTTAALTAVTLSEAFAFCSFYVDSSAGINRAPAVFFTDNETLGLTRADTSSGGTIVEWQVIEWEGATVQNGSVVLSSTTSNTGSVSAVDLAETFLIYSWSMDDGGTRPTRSNTRGEFSDSTTVLFSQGASTSGTKTVYYFAVSHPDINVQVASTSISDTSGSNTSSITAVDDLATTFVPGPWAGNQSGSYNTTPGIDSGLCIHKLDDTTTVSVTRTGTNGTITARTFVVELLGAGEPPVVVTPAEISMSSVSDTSVFISIDSYDLEATGHDMLRWNDDPGPTPDPETADDETLDIDPDVLFEDDTVSPSTTYWWALFSYIDEVES